MKIKDKKGYLKGALFGVLAAIGAIPLLAFAFFWGSLFYSAFAALFLGWDGS